MPLNNYFLKLILLPALVSPLGALAASDYKVTYAPAGFTASRMNAAGQIVGTSGYAVAVWSGKTLTKFSALASPSRGYGINNLGHLVGDINSKAFVYDETGVHHILLEQPWDETNWGNAINDAGQVVGASHAPAGEAHRGFLYSDGVLQLIGTFGGTQSEAFAINSAGQVVGHASVSNEFFGINDERAFLYEGGVLKDLGTLGGRNSSALDINDAGQIVGYSETTLLPLGQYGPRHAFLYEQGVMKDLGSLAGDNAYGFAINNAGVVVGGSGTAFIYANGEMTDLNTRVNMPEGWTLVFASDINDAGQILARACHVEDCNFWVRLTPKRAAAAQKESDDAGNED